MPPSDPYSVSQSLLSTDAYVPIGAIDIGAASSLAVTFKAVTNDLKWKVMGANLGDYSDEVEVQAEAVVVAGAVGQYTASFAPFRFYRGMQKANVAGIQGTGTLTAIAKC